MKHTPIRPDDMAASCKGKPACCSTCNKMFAGEQITTFTGRGPLCPHCGSTELVWWSWDMVEIKPKRSGWRFNFPSIRAFKASNKGAEE